MKAEGDVTVSNAKGLISGTGENTLDPGGEATRGQVAQVLMQGEDVLEEGGLTARWESTRDTVEYPPDDSDDGADADEDTDFDGVHVESPLTVYARNRLTLEAGVEIRIVDGGDMRICGALDIAEGLGHYGGRLTVAGGSLTSVSNYGTVNSTGGGEGLILSGGTISNTGTGPALVVSPLWADNPLHWNRQMTPEIPRY